MQSYASPFVPGPVKRLDKASTLSVFLFLTSNDLACTAATSKQWKQLVCDAVGLACVALYHVRLPVQRPGESLTRLLKFVESMTVVQDIMRISPGAAQVSAGTYHSFVTADSGTVYGFGDSACGQVRVWLWRVFAAVNLFQIIFPEF